MVSYSGLSFERKYSRKVNRSDAKTSCIQFREGIATCAQQGRVSAWRHSRGRDGFGKDPRSHRARPQSTSAWIPGHSKCRFSAIGCAIGRLTIPSCLCSILMNISRSVERISIFQDEETGIEVAEDKVEECRYTCGSCNAVSSRNFPE